MPEGAEVRASSCNRAAERSLAAIEQMFDVGRRVADFDSQA